MKLKSRKQYENAMIKALDSYMEGEPAFKFLTLSEIYRSRGWEESELVRELATEYETEMRRRAG